MASSSAMVPLAALVLLFFLEGTNARTFAVGGSSEWTYGFNYTDWALNTGPYNVGDTLVFKYEQLLHNVHLMKDRKHYAKCDFKGASLLANESSGSYEFVLASKKSYYFACSASDGVHCKKGLMKFTLHPQ